MDNRPKEIMLVYNNINNVFDIVKRAADRIGSKVVNEDINTFTIEIEAKGGMFSKSELITINLEKIKDLQTKIYFDDHSKQGAISSKNDCIEKMKLIIDELTPKMKMPEEAPTNDMTPNNNINQMPYDNNQYNNQVPDYTIGNNIPEAVYNNQPYQPMNNQYNGQVPDYQNQEQPYNNQMYQEQLQPMNNQQFVQTPQVPYQEQVTNYQPMEQNMQQNYMPQQAPFEQQPQVQESDPVNDLMMGNVNSNEPKAVTNVPSQSSEKKNSDPLLDFMTNMNV